MNRTFIPRKEDGSDPVQGVLGGHGAQVAGEKNSCTAWEGSRGETVLGIHISSQGPADIQDSLPKHRGTVELSN